MISAEAFRLVENGPPGDSRIMKKVIVIRTNIVGTTPRHRRIT
jgi:hypothetical protein